MIRRWVAVPFYGALLAPVWLILRELGLFALAGLGAGAALALIVRKALRRG
jgi:hypothetical protein